MMISNTSSIEKCLYAIIFFFQMHHLFLEVFVSLLKTESREKKGGLKTLWRRLVYWVAAGGFLSFPFVSEERTSTEIDIIEEKKNILGKKKKLFLLGSVGLDVTAAPAATPTVRARLEPDQRLTGRCEAIRRWK